MKCCNFFYVLLTLYIVACTDAAAQSKRKASPIALHNLVANGTFEDINVCTEFAATCEPEAWYFLPAYIVEPQGNDSNRYEVIAVSNTRYKSRAGNYLYTKLLCPLQKDRQYIFSISAATPKNQFDHLDAYFSYQEPRNHLALNTITEPSIILSSKHAIAVNTTYKKYTAIYTATGDERYITLGNFSATYPDKKIQAANNKQGEVLYAIDNVSLYPVNKNEPQCAEYYAVIKQLYDQDYRHPARMTNKLSVDSTLFLSYKKSNAALLLARSNIFTKEKIAAKADTLTIPDILFRFNSSEINPAFDSKLQSLVTGIAISHYDTMEITGHTDSVGTAAFNHRLSLLRAGVIKNYIACRLDLPGKTISIKGAGEAEPISSNNTAEGRKKNRRVEIILKRM